MNPFLTLLKRDIRPALRGHDVSCDEPTASTPAPPTRACAVLGTRKPSVEPEKRWAAP